MAEEKENFPTQVEALLRSPWTKINITQAMVTDYGEIHGITIELSREKMGGPVFYRSDNTDEKKLVQEDQLKRFLDVIAVASKEVEAIRTSAEILDSASREEAARLIQEGKLPQGWDAAELLISFATPDGKKSLNNGGLSQRLSDFLKEEFSIEKHQLSPKKAKSL